jgi:hypothetical protein
LYNECHQINALITLSPLERLLEKKNLSPRPLLTLIPLTVSTIMFKFLALLLPFLVLGGNAQLGLQSPPEPLPLKQNKGGGVGGGMKLRNDDTLAWRLNRDILPTLYQLTLTPVLHGDEGEVGEQWSVNGMAAIHVTANVEATNITLHVKDLDITNFNVHNYSFVKNPYKPYSLKCSLMNNTLN